MNGIDKINIFVPITRAIEEHGKRFVYGYACIFNTADSHGTIISQKVVKDSIPRLQKYPTLRWMHRSPLGKIVFNQEINGLSTHLDQKGFHVLAQVFDVCEKEWNMIKQGSFGFSYGLKPDKDGIQRKQIGDRFYDIFVKGLLYEISVVDTPSHADATLNKIERSLTFIPIQTKKKEACFYTMQDFQVIEFRKEGNEYTKGFAESETEERAISPDYAELYREQIFPDVCSPNCTHLTCPYHSTETYGKPCEQKWKKYRKEPEQRSLHTYRVREAEKKSDFLKEGWNIL